MSEPPSIVQNLKEDFTMSSKRTTTEKMEDTREKIAELQNYLKKLENTDKEAKRKARTKRLCRRGGFLESVLPETITLSEDRFDAFVKKHIANDHGLRILNKLLAEQEKEDADNTTTEIVQENTTLPVFSEKATVEPETDSGELEEI